MKTINLEFNGYWRHISRSGIPKQAGVYCVYQGTYDASTDKVSLKKLLYIGKATNANNRLENHERMNDWRKHLKFGEELMYSFAPISVECERAEAGIIFHHKPEENTDNVDSFPYQTTRLILSGLITLLDSDFTINQTVKKSSGYSYY